MGLYGASYLKNLNSLDKMKVQLPNATWVQDPLIVNAAHISFVDEYGTPRDQQFQPAVFVRFPPFVLVATLHTFFFSGHITSHHFTDSHHHHSHLPSPEGLQRPIWTAIHLLTRFSTQASRICQWIASDRSERLTKNPLKALIV
jgi:hypothetical protein